MNEGSKPKPMGYKQYAIHAGHEHNMVELAMREDAGHAKQVEPVLEALAAARLAEVGLPQILNLHFVHQKTLGKPVFGKMDDFQRLF